MGCSTKRAYKTHCNIQDIAKLVLNECGSPLVSSAGLFSQASTASVCFAL